MEVTVYGLRLVRAPVPSLVDAIDQQQRHPGAICLTKTWPDGSRCRVLTVNAAFVPDQRVVALDVGITPKGRLIEVPPPWHEFARPVLFDPERDEWSATPHVHLLVLRLCRETYMYGRPLDLLEVTPRRLA
jgi:hypothetical protein